MYHDTIKQLLFFDILSLTCINMFIVMLFLLLLEASFPSLDYTRKMELRPWEALLA